MRRLGSAALDLCYVAPGGSTDTGNCHCTLGLAAGGLIAEEAGARVTNVQDGPDYLTAPQSVVAANPAIHAEILRVLSENDGNVPRASEVSGTSPQKRHADPYGVFRKGSCQAPVAAKQNDAGCSLGPRRLCARTLFAPG